MHIRVQSELKSPNHTKVLMPLRSLCLSARSTFKSHVLSSASWALHLDSVLKDSGRTEFANTGPGEKRRSNDAGLAAQASNLAWPSWSSAEA